MLRMAVFIALIASVAAAGYHLKKSDMIDPAFCYTYSRVNGVCSGIQSVCGDASGTPTSGAVADSYPSNCGSNSEFKAFADTDFPTRDAAFKAAQGK